MKLSSRQLSGRMVGGIIMLSSTVLKLVRNIHTKGKIMTMEPMMKKA